MDFLNLLGALTVMVIFVALQYFWMFGMSSENRLVKCLAYASALCVFGLLAVYAAVNLYDAWTDLQKVMSSGDPVSGVVGFISHHLYLTAITCLLGFWGLYLLKTYVEDTRAKIRGHLFSQAVAKTAAKPKKAQSRKS